MPNEKLTLPKQVSDTVQIETHRTRRAEVAAGAQVEVARLEVAKEALSATKAFFAVLKSRNELEQTRIEWSGRVEAAEASVYKAQTELETARENNRPAMEELRQNDIILVRLLSLFDDVMAELSSAELSPESRRESRSYLLDLSDRIVKLKR